MVCRILVHRGSAGTRQVQTCGRKNSARLPEVITLPAAVEIMEASSQASSRQAVHPLHSGRDLG